MLLKLLKHNKLFLLLVGLLSLVAGAQQTTVFTQDFTTSAGTSYSTVNGAIGSSSTWSMLRSGTDMGARINSGYLDLTNDATGASNSAGWVLAYRLAATATPYNATLGSNPGTVTWTFNMRQYRTNPSGVASNNYGNAVVLAGTSNTTATTGTGYAVILGNSGNTDPVRLVRYSAGLRTSTDMISSNTSGVNDFGRHYISVKVTYSPSTNTWELFARKDGSSAFANPATGYYSTQGTLVNNTYTATSLPLLGAFWNAGTKSKQTAYFDNYSISVATPVLASISPTSKVAGSAAFPLTVTGSNFTSASVIQWNGVALTTTYVSATQLTASIPAANVATTGTAAITVATGAAVSGSQTFYIDAVNTPSISTSTSALTNFTTITGTPSAAQSFTSTGTSLGSGNNITITAPTNFEVSNSAAGPYSASIPVTAATTTTYVRVSASAPSGLYSNVVLLAASGATTRHIALTATVLSTEPTTAATSLTFTNTNSIQTTINWTGGNGSNHLVVVRQASAVAATLADGATYFASTTFGSGADVGTTSYVVYAGSANSVTVMGLNPATTYYATVYEYNGSGGTENYRTTGISGSTTTLNAPLGLQLKAVNTVYSIDFDNTVEGVNNSTYAGAGLADFPDVGDLNTNSFVLSPITTTGVTFGGDILDDDPAYGNGLSDGGVTDGGFYAFQVATGNYALGIQPDATYPSGSTTLRFQNQTGTAITSVNIGYKIYVRNDEAGANSYNFFYSPTNANNVNYLAATVLNQTTTAAADAVSGWKMYYKVVTLTGLNISANSYYYIRWSGDVASGTAYDEIALDDITIVANPTSNYAPLAGTVQTAVLAGNSNLSGATTVNGDITFNGGKQYLGANTLTLNGTVTNTTTAGLSGSASSNLVVSGAVSPTLSFDQTTVGTTNLLNNLTVTPSGTNTVTLGNNVVVNGALTVDESQTFALGTNTLTGTLATITNNGTVTTTNTTTTPFASGKTWGGTGWLAFNAATAAQYLPAGTYNKVTINTTGGGNATGDITLNGDLNLPNANVSATKGAFDTAAYSIIMGANSFNTGAGDVSGIVTRNSPIVNNVAYTFGHSRTTIFYPTTGTLPTSMSIKIVLGSAPAGKTDAILRTYDFIQTGGTGTKATISAHYLDSELNSNTENNLVDWVVVVPSTLVEQGRTNYGTIDNFVELSNVNVAFFSSTFGSKLLTLANSQVATVTWNGSVSTSWTTAANWSPNATPSDATNVIIPDAATTPNDPILNSSVTIGTLNIQTGGILNTPTGGQLNITKASGAWINQGTYNPSNGTVAFTVPLASGDATIAGSTTFYNLTIPAGTNLRPVTDNVMDIGGTFTKDGNLYAGSVTNTIIYSGTNQTVITPNGALGAYDNLTINGTGAIIPASINIAGNLITNQAVNFAGTTVNMIGTEAAGQRIGGTVSPSFNNLTVNKPSGSGTLILQNNIAVTGTLTLNSGLLDIASYNLTLGANAVAGTFSTTSMIDADGTGRVIRPYTGVGSYTFPIGETTSNTSYSPLTINVTAGTFNNASIAVNLTDATHPNNYGTTSYFTRYWSVTETGITGAVVTITGNYTLGDAVGGESVLSAAQLNGTFNAITNPWVKFGTLGNTTFSATNATLTSGQTSYFSGITLSPVSVTVDGGGTFCQNTTVQLSSAVSGGVGNYTYSWSNGLGSGSTAVPPTNTVGSVTYTLTVRDANGIVGTANAVVTVTAAPNAGTLSSNQSICANSTPAAITLTGYVGTIVRWERSTSTSFPNPTFIASTNATLTGAEIGTTLTATRYLRAVVQNGSCDVVYSNYVEVKINTTTWDGTAWDNGAPTATDAVIFNGDYTAGASFAACTIVVNNGADVLVPSNFTATVNGAVTVNEGGSLTFSNNAALVQLTNAVNAGNIIFHKTSNPLFRLDYTLWAAPVTGQQLRAFSMGTSNNRFYVYKYDTADNGITYDEAYWPVDPLNTYFEAAKGYLIRMPNVITANVTGTTNGGTTTPAQYIAGTGDYIFDGAFTGVPNNGSFNPALSQLGNRYTAVGNPYPSPISVADFLSANSTKLVTDTGVWFWRKRNNQNVESYVTLNLFGYTANPSDSTTNSTGLGSFYQGSSNTWLIAPGQGFFVQAKPSLAEPTVSFTNSMRRSSPGTQAFFRSAADTASRYWINVTAQDGRSSQMMVGYTEGATLDIDYGYDSKKLGEGSTISLYSIAQGSKLAIQARPAFAVNDVVPMGFTAPVAGLYTISLDHFDGIFADGQTVYLRDNTEGIVRNLNLNNYTFTSEAGTFEGRFDVIYTTSALGTDNPVPDANSVIVFKDNNTIQVNSESVLINSITIYDTRGRKLYTQSGINATDAKITGLAIAQQVLIVEVDTVKGKISTRIVY
ncbi:T9SS sorting signal type C domain-containing protein [Flavobacterium psychrotrophum]|uniref:T9SS sorting signal type C domain-containing protein n=1 Tax=Flavobacterium psychrotrophum TaxID=2294119 RepID=UPI000E30D3B7|nr:T9SS sorting signal type C domain-containing protein [Flavobacterium psychrotrophum]